MRKRTIIGVTGGFASGKTTISDMFVKKGARKIDADEIAHKILREDDRVKQKLIKLFDTDILDDGEINKKKLAKKVFCDSKKLEELCRLTHPMIIDRIKKEAARFPGSTLVIDAPLLIEAGLRNYADIVVLIRAGTDICVKRALSRGISSEEARNIINNQMPLSEKVKFADYIIDNDMNLNVAKKGVDRIWEKI